MKKLSMMGAAVMLATIAFAQNDSLKSSTLDDVTITANKLAQKQSTTAKVVTIIDKQEIEKNSGRSIGQLLNEQAGITVNGALSNLGSPQSLYMRGAAVGRTLILLDGVPVYDPSLINSEFDLNLLSLNDVERIEICKGAQSTLYGSDAVAGVINIITTKSDTTKPFNLKATGIAGNYDTYKGNVQVFGQQKGLTYSARYSKLKSNGFSAAHDSTSKGAFEKDGYNGDVAAASLKYAFNEKLSARSFIQYSRYKSDVDASIFRDEKDFTIGNKSIITGAGLVYSGKRFTVTGNYQYSDIKRNYLNDSLDIAGFSKYEKNDFYGKNQFAEIYAHIILIKGLSLLAGADYRYGNMNNQYLSISAFGPYESEFKDTSVSQTSMYATMMYSGLNGRLHVDLGGRLNNHSRYGTNYTYTFNPSFAITNHYRIFGSIASGFKAPSLYQLYAGFGVGNKELKAEASTNYEIGIEQQHAIISNRLVYFYRDINNGIDYDNVNYSYFNFIRRNVNGLEWEMIVKPTSRLTIRSNYTFLTSKEHTQSRETTNDTTYAYLLRRPKHAFNIHIGQQFNSKLYAGIGSKIISDRYDVGGYQVPDVKLDAYIIFNAYAAYSFNKHVKVFADAQNLTNKKFFEINGYNAIPFIINGGITFTL